MKTLFDIGFEKGLQYETVIMTKDHDGSTNAAPIGVICKGKSKIMCRIFKGSRTLANILDTGRFTVNVLKDPSIFTQSTLSTINPSYLKEDMGIKCCDSYFTCTVNKFINAIKRSDPVNKSEAIVIQADVDKIVVRNDEEAPFNRSFGLLIESLINCNNFDLNPQYYSDRFKEARRVITKVGSKQEKESMNMIMKYLEERGFKI